MRSGSNEGEHYFSLFEAVLTLKDQKECERFFKDLCTPQELSVMKSRWLVCQILMQAQKSYRQIAEETGVSLATITRIARFLHEEPHQGYKLMLKRLGVKNSE